MTSMPTDERGDSEGFGITFRSECMWKACYWDKCRWISDAIKMVSMDF